MGQLFAADALLSFVRRIEYLECERGKIADDVREVYAKAKGVGFDVRTLRAVVRLRKQDESERQAQAALLDIYLHALGQPLARQSHQFLLNLPGGEPGTIVKLDDVRKTLAIRPDLDKKDL